LNSSSTFIKATTQTLRISLTAKEHVVKSGILTATCTSAIEFYGSKNSTTEMGT